MENLIKILKENNKSGSLTNEIFFKKKYYDYYLNIINHHTLESNKITFKDKIFLYINNLNKIPKCKTCGSTLKLNRGILKGYGTYCSVSCMNKNSERKEGIKNANLLKYGVESHNQLESVKNKKIETSIKNFGSTNPMKNNDVKNKQINSLINNYGVNNSMKIESVINDRKYNINNINNFNVARMINRINDNYILIKKESSVNIFYHKTCKQNFEINSNLLNARLNLNIEICLNCNKLKSYSNIFLKIKNLLILNKIDFIENDRTKLDGLEIDIYVPSHNIGFEIDGLYWHSSKYKSNDYHVKKQNKAKEKNIRLIQFFEDEIEFKYEIVESMIKNFLNLSEIKIYARKTLISKINFKTYKDFLNKNHIQGYVYSSLAFGLFYENELVSVMTFCNKRKNILTNADDYEMVRFSNKLNTRVIGGASKLLSFFIKNHKFNDLYSFANRRYSNGDLYNKLNFIKVNENKLNYWYVDLSKKMRINRLKFQKHKLISMGYDKNKTQSQIIDEIGLPKIYDSGTIKFKYKKTE